MGKIIAIANQKGGVGKTTTTVNLSACVAERGKRVLCIDIDPQGNCTSGVGVDKEAPEHSVYDVLINGVPAGEAAVPAAVENLFVIPARKELSGAEVELVNTMARETVLKRALAGVRGEYDYIFIDCPPSLDLLTINGVDASFVAIAKNGGVNISARSMGALNVQVILEPLGGGGHLTMAGAQLRDCTVKEAEARIRAQIDEYRANQECQEELVGAV